MQNVIFENGETEKTITVKLIDGKDTKNGAVDEEPEDKMFRVLISDPEPKAVKMSRKNCVFVTITHEEE